MSKPTKHVCPTNYDCPKWLSTLILAKDSQVRETERYDASAHGIISRLLNAANEIDEMVARQLSTCDCKGNAYSRGLANGLLLAQAQIRDCEFKPL